MAKVIDQLKNDPLMPLRHTCEHVLHTAMQELYPSLKKVMGPPIEEGFYFDFDLDEKITPEDFEKIEQRMQEIIDANLPIVMKELSYDEAKSLFAYNQYKLNTIDEIKERGEKTTVYQMGERDTDLCAGPHTAKTGDIKAFKLLSVAGAYYKGNEKNKMLQRIYGTAFDSKDKLDTYLNLLEEQKKRDHRKIGKDLNLFAFADEVGPGLVLWTPKGNLIREELENWAKETEKKWGYQRVSTPHIAKHTLYEISGHLPYYRDDMYSPMEIDGEEYFLKGMNCPHHHMIYKSSPKSYKELPLRLAEYGMVYRYEQSGTLFGLMRVRSICQNDAHIYCTIESAEEEFLQVLKMHEYYYNSLGLTKNDYYMAFGLPDPAKKDKYHGDAATWQKAKEIMFRACERSGIRTVDDVGGAAFYGPKIDFTIKSSIGREFAISTVQLDLFMPQRFNLEYTDKDGSKKQPAVIHRAPLGSHERFIGFLIEHFGGAFPLWLSPVHVQILTISEEQLEYAHQIKAQLEAEGVRVELNDKDEKIGAKIRDAQLQKIPYMIVLGKNEMHEGTLSVRSRDGREERGLKPTDFVNRVANIIRNKELGL